MMQLLNDIQLTDKFWLSEFACDDKVDIDIRLVKELQKLRDIVGKRIIVTSGYRTPERNKRIGGSSKSKHMEGIAADIYVEDMSVEEVYFIAKHLQFNGIGLYNHHIHLDIREKKAFWDNRTHKTYEIKI